MKKEFEEDFDRERNLEEAMALTNEILKDIPVDEYTKGVIRGLVKKNQMFEGTEKNEEACERYEKMVRAAEFFVEYTKLPPETLSFSGPMRYKRHALIFMDLPDFINIKNTAAKGMLAFLIKQSDEVTLAEKEFDPEDTDRSSPMILTFTVKDTWM